jgi:4-hydroxybenzoate polyprenyltransferase
LLLKLIFKKLKFILGICQSLIYSNLYISIAAVFLTIETQIQLGMKPQFHPYVFIIFFATLFEYNIHRLILVLTNKDALNHDRHSWIKKYPKRFYFIVFFSILGFLVSILLAKEKVLIALAPIGLLTIFYSLPFLKKLKYVFRLREIPFLKIFLISFVWSIVTILLPIIQSNNNYDNKHILLMLIERFIFVFAITIPFDIRDISDDRASGLKTIPILIGQKKSIVVANISLLLFTTICLVHYPMYKLTFILPGLILSALSTLFFLNNKMLRSLYYYHYCILDGTMILQGFLVIIFFYFLN